MSEYKRIERLIKSLIPRFDRRPTDANYQLADVRHMINELGLHMTPGALQHVLADDKIVDDFLMSIIELERYLGKRVVLEDMTIDPELVPRVYEEDGVIGFSVEAKDQEIVFAEYPYSPIQ